MPNNIYRFRQTKWADPKRFKLIADGKPSWRGARYLSGLIVLCMLTGFVAVQARPKFESQTAGVSALSVLVIDDDTISLDDGKRRWLNKCKRRGWWGGQFLSAYPSAWG